MQIKKHNALIFVLFSIVMILALLVLCLLEARCISPADRDASASPYMTVVIDAGHGGEDGGAVGNGKVYEKDLNLDIAKTVGAYLTQNGFNVVYTRTEDILLYDRNVNYKGRKKLLDLTARLQIARKTENSIFVSIHMNSFPSGKYKGLQVYYSKNDKNSKIMAQTIQNNTMLHLQSENKRKPKEATSAIYLLDRLEKPAVLIECGFLSNAEDLALLTSAEYRQKLSLVFAESIAQYLLDESAS